MNLFSVGQPFNTSVPDVYIVEDFGQPPISDTIGSNVIGIVGAADWGGDEVIYQSSNPRDLVKLFGGRENELGKKIDSIAHSGRYNIAAVRVVGAGALAASLDAAAGSTTTWDFAWTFRGSKGNDTLLEIVLGDIADTVTLIFKLDDDYFILRNVDNDPDSENYIGDKFNIPNMTFTKTGVSTDLPEVTTSDLEFTGGDDGSPPVDGDYIDGSDKLLGSTDITHFMYAKTPTPAALITAAEGYASEYQIFHFVTPTESDIVTDFADCITEAKGYTSKFVCTCMGNVYYFNRDTNATEHIPLVGFITMAAKYGATGSPLGKNSPYRWVETWSKLQREQMSDVHLCYARNDGQGWYINDLRTGVRDLYQSDVMVRSTYNIVERIIARNLRSAIGMTGKVDERKARIAATLRGVGQFLTDRGILEEYAVDVSKITDAMVARGELVADFYVGKFPANRTTIIHVKRLTDGSTSFTEEVL